MSAGLAPAPPTSLANIVRRSLHMAAPQVDTKPEQQYMIKHFLYDCECGWYVSHRFHCHRRHPVPDVVGAGWFDAVNVDPDYSAAY